MVDTSTVATLNGLYKEVYSDEGLQELVPEASTLQKIIEFKDGVETLGGTYVVPMVLSLEQGITFGGTAGTAFDLNPPVSMNIVDARVDGDDHVLRSAISYGAAARAIKNGPASFANSTSEIMKSAIESMSRVIEIEMLYGQAATGLGTIATINSVNATTVTLNFGTGQWAAGIWSGSKNLKLDLLDASNSTVVNSVAALVVSSVSFVNKSITVTGNSTDVTAIVALFGGMGTGFVTWYNSYSNQFIGMNKIFNNATGSLFNISASTYELWASNQFAVGGNLTLDVIGDGLALAQTRGLDTDVDLLVSPITWKYLNRTAVSRKRLNDGYGSEKSEFGSKAIDYYTQSGWVKVWSHIYCKEGEAYAFPREKICRVGARKMSFQNPGAEFDGQIFRQLDNQAGYEFRLYGNEALIGLKPAAFTIFTGLTNVG